MSEETIGVMSKQLTELKEEFFYLNRKIKKDFDEKIEADPQNTDNYIIEGKRLLKELDRRYLIATRQVTRIYMPISDEKRFEQTYKDYLRVHGGN